MNKNQKTPKSKSAQAGISSIDSLAFISLTPKSKNEIVLETLDAESQMITLTKNDVLNMLPFLTHWAEDRLEEFPRLNVRKQK